MGFGIWNCYASDDISVKAAVDKPVAYIGDRLSYKIEVKAPADTTIEFPRFAENLGGFAVRDFGATRKKNVFKKAVTNTQQYALQTYSLGKYEIPPAVIKYKTAQGKTGSAATGKVCVEIKSLLMIDGKEPVDIKDIKPPLYFKKNLLILTGVFLLLFSAGLAALLRFLKKKGVFSEPPRRLEPAHKIAYRQLDELLAADLIASGLIKEYFFRLSFIVRQYIENRFQLRAPEMTTEEFLTVMKGSDALDSQIKGLLKGFLEKADMVKFAKYGPAAEEITVAFDAAKRLVDETAI